MGPFLARGSTSTAVVECHVVISCSNIMPLIETIGQNIPKLLILDNCMVWQTARAIAQYAIWQICCLMNVAHCTKYLCSQMYSTVPLWMVKALGALLICAGKKFSLSDSWMNASKITHVHIKIIYAPKKPQNTHYLVGGKLFIRQLRQGPCIHYIRMQKQPPMLKNCRSYCSGNAYSLCRSRIIRSKF